jgi:hypothetical protein
MQKERYTMTRQSRRSLTHSGFRRTAAKGEAMDTVDQYREIVTRLFEEYAGYKPAYGEVRTEAVVDRDRDHYEVMQLGWNDGLRVHGSIIHIDIREGKVWMEYSGTDARIGEELVAAGIPRRDIALGFQPAKLRPLTGYGVD